MRTFILSVTVAAVCAVAPAWAKSEQQKLQQARTELAEQIEKGLNPEKLAKACGELQRIEHRLAEIAKASGASHISNPASRHCHN